MCSAFMVEAWTTEFVSAIMFTILENRKGSWGSLNSVVSPYYTQCKVRLDHGRLAPTVYGMFFPLQWTHVCLSEAGNLTLLNLVKDGKLVVDGKLLQEEEYQRKYKPSDPLLRNLGFKANPTLAVKH